MGHNAAELIVDQSPAEAASRTLEDLCFISRYDATDRDTVRVLDLKIAAIDRVTEPANRRGESHWETDPGIVRRIGDSLVEVARMTTLPEASRNRATGLALGFMSHAHILAERERPRGTEDRRSATADRERQARRSRQARRRSTSEVLA